MLSYHEIWCPDDALEKARIYAETEVKESKSDKLEGCIAIEWEDGEQGFKFWILDALKNMHVTTRTKKQVGI